jgi:hypothetical protein
MHDFRDRDGRGKVAGDVGFFLEVRAHDLGVHAQYVLVAVYFERHCLSDLPAFERLETRDMLIEVFLQQTDDLVLIDGRFD